MLSSELSQYQIARDQIEILRRLFPRIERVQDVAEIRLLIQMAQSEAINVTRSEVPEGERVFFNQDLDFLSMLIQVVFSKESSEKSDDQLDIALAEAEKVIAMFPNTASIVGYPEIKMMLHRVRDEILGVDVLSVEDEDKLSRFIFLGQQLSLLIDAANKNS